MLGTRVQQGELLTGVGAGRVTVMPGPATWVVQHQDEFLAGRGWMSAWAHQQRCHL